jgi:anti-sigma factor RsiW
LNCPEAQNLIHPYSDGELDLVKSLEVERHIQECGACTEAHQALADVRSAIHDGAPYYRASATLERVIRTKQARTAAVGRSAWSPRWVVAAAAMVLIATAVWMAVGRMGRGSEELLASEVTSAHVRSLMLVEHLWDVKSTDQHTVKPWFDGKIDFAPEVRDFKADSFALEGGRLDYLANRAVAALVYRHEKHYVNLFIWPAPGRSDEAEAVTRRQGYVLVHWVRSGMNYWAVSDMSEDALRRFTSLVQSASPPATKPSE